MTFSKVIHAPYLADILPDLLVNQSALAHPPKCGRHLVPYLQAVDLVGAAIFAEDWEGTMQKAKNLKLPAFVDYRTFKTPPPAGTKRTDTGLQYYSSYPSEETRKKANQWLSERWAWEDGADEREAQAEEEYRANATWVSQLNIADTKLREVILTRKIILYWYNNYTEEPLKHGAVADGEHSATLQHNGCLKVGGEEKAVFVLRNKLEDFLKPNEEKIGLTMQEFEGVYLSPYMRIMLQVAKEAELSQDNQPTVESLATSIAVEAEKFGLDLWREGGFNEIASTRKPNDKAKYFARALRDNSEKRG